jgi:hypothetical protein
LSPTLPQRRGWRCSARDGVVMAGVAAQGRWRRRRPALLVRRHGVDSGGRGTGVRPPFEGSAVLFRGSGASAVRERVAQCHGVDTGLTAQCPTAAGMASPGGLAEQRRGMIPKRIRGTACVDSFAGVRALNAPVGGAGTGAASSWGPRARRTSPAGASSPRARRTSPEGASSPQARRNLTRGGVQPSSEAGFR